MKQEKDGNYWTPDERMPKLQYKDPSGARPRSRVWTLLLTRPPPAPGTLMMLPSDLVLIQDEGFKPFVEAYAKARACGGHSGAPCSSPNLPPIQKDKKLFYADFAADYSKLLELGCNGLVEVA